MQSEKFLFQNSALSLGSKNIKAVLREIKILCLYNGQVTSSTRYFQAVIAHQNVTRNNVYHDAKAF